MTTAELQLAEPPAALEQRRASDTPLHAGTDPPLEPVELGRWIEPLIADRLERAAWWPEHTLREGWKLGDFSVYGIGFASAGFKALYVRFISEPDRTAMLEISASNDDPHFRTAAPAAMRAALADAGFRPGGARSGYCKPVLVESREDCEVLAREIAGLLTGCLGYTGLGPLEQVHAFKERTEPARIFTTVTLGDVERLLRSSKLVVETRDLAEGPGFWTAQAPRFLVALFSETSAGSGWYRALRFHYSMRMETGLAEGLIEVMRRKTYFVEMTASDDHLWLEHCVLIEGGVTEEHLRAQLRHWRSSLATITAVRRRMKEDADD